MKYHRTFLLQKLLIEFIAICWTFEADIQMRTVCFHILLAVDLQSLLFNCTVSVRHIKNSSTICYNTGLIMKKLSLCPWFSTLDPRKLILYRALPNTLSVIFIWSHHKSILTLQIIYMSYLLMFKKWQWSCSTITELPGASKCSWKSSATALTLMSLHLR